MTTASNSQTNTATRPAQVLIVSADVAMAEELVTVLHGAGHMAAHVVSPVDALEACASQSYQLAIVDESVCELAGPELARTLRDLFDVYTLFISAYEDLEIVAATLVDGSLGFIAKPLYPAGLLPALHVAIARAQSMQRKAPPNTLRRYVDAYWRQLLTMGNKLFAATDDRREINAAILRSRRVRNEPSAARRDTATTTENVSAATPSSRRSVKH